MLKLTSRELVVVASILATIIVALVAVILLTHEANEMLGGIGVCVGAAIFLGFVLRAEVVECPLQRHVR
jgi:hypothetical protein